MKFIGGNLRKLRDSMNWTLEDLEELSGVSQSTLSDMETEKKQPRNATVEKLCKVFKIDQLYFYTPESRLIEEILPDMPDNTKRFLLSGENTPYILISQEAKEAGIPAETLKQVLDILIRNRN